MARGRNQGPTRVEDVYRALKNDILTGRMSPGSRINLADLCKAQDVSLTVVREAVTRLASERLAHAVPNQGFKVWPLSVPDLLDLTRVRIEIETLVLRESVRDGDLHWEAELVAAHHRMAGAAKAAPIVSPQGPNYEWRAAHSEFHAALGAACSSALLKSLRQQLFDSALLYQHWSATLGPKAKRKRRVAAEHRALLDRALAHDADQVVELMAAHINRTTETLLAAVEASPPDERGAAVSV